MRRVTLPLLVSAVLVLAGCQAAAEDGEPDRPPLRVLVAGDSLADGYYAADRAHGFAALVTEGLGAAHEVTPVVVAVPGARALGVAIEVAERSRDQPPVDVAVLEAGSNDVGESSLRAWSQTYRRLLAAVRAGSPDARVVCLGPWGPPGGSQAYEDVVRRLCEDDVYVRLSDLYATAGMRGPVGAATGFGARDGFHPNDAGHAAIAARVLDALR